MTKNKSDIILDLVQKNTEAIVEIGKKVEGLGSQIGNVCDRIKENGERVDEIKDHADRSRTNLYQRMTEAEKERAVMKEDISIMKKEIYGNGKVGICGKIDKVINQLTDVNKFIIETKTTKKNTGTFIKIIYGFFGILGSSSFIWMIINFLKNKI